VELIRTVSFEHPSVDQWRRWNYVLALIATAVMFVIMFVLMLAH
jgi:hypothetical protein